MNNFLVFVRKSDTATVPTADLLDPYLVRKPSSSEEWSSQNGRIFILSFQVCAQRAQTNLYFDGPSALTFDGFPFSPNTSCVRRRHHGETLLNEIRYSEQELKDLLSGEFSLAFVNGETLLVTTSLGGSHPLYYTINQDFIAFSNRAPVLLALPSTSDDLSVDASSWLCFQGYVGGLHTPFEKVKKLPLGATATVNKNANLKIETAKYRDIRDFQIQEFLTKDPTAAFDDMCMKIVDYLQRFTAYHDSQPLRVRLSGGKDSRLVLGLLLRAGLKNSISTVLTFGPSYSPEVLAAQDVCEVINFDNHEIRRPHTTPNPKISFRLITNSINYTEGNLSLFDFMAIDQRRQTNVCGHQLVLRPGAYKDCRVSSLEEFVEDATVARLHDPMFLLHDEFRDRIRSDFAETFRNYRNEGAPLTELGDLFLLRDRLLNWAAVMNNADYYSGPLTNPLLLPEVFRFAFSLPIDVRSCEIPHYVWMRSCDPRLPEIPFADDAWKPGLYQKLMEIGMQVDYEERPVIAYQSHSSFPNFSNPLVSSMKIEYFRALRPLMAQLLEEQKGRVSEYLDANRLGELLAVEWDPSFRELYCMMGIYTDLLLHGYGKDLFHRDASADIAEGLCDRSKSTRAGKTGFRASDSNDANDPYEDALLQHELCVAALVREIQNIRDDTAKERHSEIGTSSHAGYDGFIIVTLPKERIRQVRIDPMNESGGEFALRAVVLLTGPEVRQIPFLERHDYFNIINAEVLSTADGVIRFRATGRNRPWLGLKGLNDLDLRQVESTELFVSLKSSGGRQITVYWDIGDGYNSEHCKRIDW